MVPINPLWICVDTYGMAHATDPAAEMPVTSPRADQLPHHASAHHLSEFWQSFMRLGFGVLGGESLAVIVYLLLTPSGQHRTLIEIIAVLTLVSASAGMLLASHVVETTWHSTYSLGVTLAAGVVITVCCALDGGIDSPLIYLAVLPVVSAALALPARHVEICAVATIVQMTLLAVFDPDVTSQSGTLVLIFSSAIGVSAFAVLSAVARARLQAAENLVHDELAHLAETDQLTGCLNHGAFNSRLSNEIDRFDRYGSVCCLMVADVDLLKSYNDTYGHLAGDKILTAIGSGLMRSARRSDIVARIGGDEFAVILPSSSLEDAKEVAQRVRTELDSAVGVDVTLSIGIAALDPSEPTARRLFRDADSALYSAKSGGRARIVASSDRGTRSGRPIDPERCGRNGKEDRNLLETRLRQVERESAETGALMDAILAAAPVGLCFVDQECRILRINDVLAQFLMGKDAVDTPRGKKVPDVVSPALWRQLEPAYRRVFAEGAPAVVDDVVTEGGDTSGQLQYWHSTFFPVRLNREIMGLGVVAVDVTDRRELQDAERHLIRSVVGALGAAVEARDPYTSGHQQSVALIAAAIAVELGLEAKTVDEIELAARIHDLGKVRVPAEILARPGRLNAAEMTLVREHPRIGDEILSSVDFPSSIREMVFQHHERMDGSGYPRGLVGDEICIGARVIAVADVVDSMASDRPYRTELGREAALREISERRGSLYDAQVVDACLRIFRHHSLPTARLGSGRVSRGRAESVNARPGREMHGAPGTPSQHRRSGLGGAMS